MAFAVGGTRSVVIATGSASVLSVCLGKSMSETDNDSRGEPDVVLVSSETFEHAGGKGASVEVIQIVSGTKVVKLCQP